MGQKQKGSSNGFLPRSSLSLFVWFRSGFRSLNASHTFFAFGFSGCFACHSFCHFHFNFHSHAAAHAVIRMCFRCFVLLTIFAAVKQQICRPLANCFRSTILIVIVIDAPFRFGACLSFFLSFYLCMYVCMSQRQSQRTTNHRTKPYLHTNVAHLLQIWRPLDCSLVLLLLPPLCSLWLLLSIWQSRRNDYSALPFACCHHASRTAPPCPAMRSFNKVRFNFALQ